MNRRALGKTGFQVAEISFGAWQIGGVRYGVVPEVEAHTTLQSYLEVGGNFIDTARGYNESERVLGNYFYKNGGRENIYVASKTGSTDAQQIKNDLGTSLQLLQTEYLDLYYLHNPPVDVDEMNRVVDIYDRLKTQGKIKAIGASIKGPDVTRKTTDLFRKYIQSGRVDVLMIVLSIFRQKNAEILDEAQAANIGIVPRTVLESGFLSGKYLPGYEFPEGDHRTRWGKQRLSKILTQVQDLSYWAIEEPYKTLSQVALRFVLDQVGVSSLVVGARTKSQIEEIITVADMPPLSSTVRERITTQFSGGDAAFNTGE
jgi:aryl-alcohol dehydrogenase-like predicted oxidoreductase